MGLFDTILNKLGITKKKEEAAPKPKPTVRRTAAQATAARAERLKRIRAMREAAS